MSPKIDKGSVDMRFLRNIFSLCKIAIPGWWTAEVLHLAVLTIGLVLRTYLSIEISSINGKIVRGIVTRNW